MIDETGVNFDSTFIESIQFMKEFGAGLLKMSANDENDEPICGVILIRGAEETKEIFDAVEAIEAGWDAEKAPKKTT